MHIEWNNCAVKSCYATNQEEIVSSLMFILLCQSTTAAAASMQIFACLSRMYITCSSLKVSATVSDDGWRRFESDSVSIRDGSGSGILKNAFPFVNRKC